MAVTGVLSARASYVASRNVTTLTYTLTNGGASGVNVVGTPTVVGTPGSSVGKAIPGIPGATLIAAGGSLSYSFGVMCYVTTEQADNAPYIFDFEASATLDDGSTVAAGPVQLNVTPVAYYVPPLVGALRFDVIANNALPFAACCGH